MFPKNVSRLSTMGVVAICTVLATACIGGAQDPVSSQVIDGVSSSKQVLGIADQQPSSGLYVELPDHTFMVPYTTVIPGTSVEFTMVPIRPGAFMMGSSVEEGDHQPEEVPQVEVKVDAFWMGQMEVTCEEFEVFQYLDYIMRRSQEKDNKRIVNAENQVDGVSGPSVLYDPSIITQYGEGPKQPASMLTCFSAKQYTKFLSLVSNSFYRLPTEAEWEYACRAGTKTAFHFGDDPDRLPDFGWFFENSNDKRHDVGQKKANPWGLYDMHGNVAEWTLDQYSKDGFKLAAEMQASKHQKLSVAQAWNRPTRAFPLVLRGGGYFMDADQCRSASRFPSEVEEWKLGDPELPNSPWWYTDEPASAVGFRILRPLHEPENRSEKEAFWAPAHPSVQEDVDLQWEDGRISRGIIDPSLKNEIRKSLRERAIER